MLDCGAKHFTRYYLSFDDQWYVEFGSFFFLFLSILVIRMAFQKKNIFFIHFTNRKAATKQNLLMKDSNTREKTSSTYK